MTYLENRFATNSEDPWYLIVTFVCRLIGSTLSFLCNLTPSTASTLFSINDSPKVDLLQYFQICELDSCLGISKSSSPGPDNIHYKMVSHLPINAKILFLFICNSFLDGKSISVAWKETLIGSSHFQT